MISRASIHSSTRPSRCGFSFYSLITAAVFPALLFLAACGGGGDSSSSDTTTDVTYTMGGTVSGLVGALELRLNGGDDLLISADGPFIFTTPLSDGANYAVTIETQPTDQFCTITNGTGSIAGAKVTDVTIACADFVATLDGTIQKGPFIEGSTVIIAELDQDLSPTGSQFNESTNNNLGQFDTTATITSPFVEVITTGFFFDEINNQLSDATLTLRTVSAFAEGETVNVNLLTQLASRRVETLVLTGMTFEEALAQAQPEVLAIFNIDATGVPDFDSLDISKGGTGDAILLAISAVLMQAAVNAGGNTSAVISEMMAQIGGELESDGALSNETIIEQIRQAGMDVDLAAVRANLEARFEDLGETVDAPTFENFVDHDGDGLLPGEDDNQPDAFTLPMVENVAPETVVFSQLVTVTGINGVVMVALTGTGASLIVDCVEADPATCVPLPVTRAGDTAAGTPDITETEAVVDTTLRVRLVAPSELEGTATATLSVGEATETFTVTTFPLGTFAFALEPVVDAPLDTVTDSNEITVEGIEAGTFLPLTLTGGILVKNGAEVAVTVPGDSGQGTADVTTATVTNGDAVKVRLRSATTFATAVTATLDIGAVSSDFTITTQELTNADFALTPAQVENADPGSVQTTEDLTVFGLTGPQPVTLTGGRLIKNGATQAVDTQATADTGAITTIEVYNGDVLNVRLTAAGTANSTDAADFNVATTATLEIGSTSRTFTVTTFPLLAYDFNFTQVADADLSTVHATANVPITLPLEISYQPVHLTGSGVVLKNGEPTDAPFTVVDGDTVAVQLTASDQFDTTESATLTIGSVAKNFTVSTFPLVAVTLDLGSVADAEPGVEYTSDVVPVTLPGNIPYLPVTLSAGTLVKNGDDEAGLTTTVQSGDNLQVKLTATGATNSTTAADFGVTETASLTVGSTSADYTVTTYALTAYTHATFTGQKFTGTALGANPVFNDIEISGLTVPYLPASLSAGILWQDTGSGFSIVAGNETTVRNGDWLRVRVTASAINLTTVTEALTVGLSSRDYSVKTVPAVVTSVSAGPIAPFQTNTILVQLTVPGQGESYDIILCYTLWGYCSTPYLYPPYISGPYWQGFEFATSTAGGEVQFYIDRLGIQGGTGYTFYFSIFASDANDPDDNSYSQVNIAFTPAGGQ